MAFRFLNIELAVQTATRRSVHRVDFTSGLNVIQAPNSWGKSTLVQSLVYGLGLEGAFSTSHLSPLGEAMTSVIDLNGQREAVVESSVTLTIESDQGIFLRTRRFAQSPTYEQDLIQTWAGTSDEELSTAERKDLYVRQSGAATHELGFHRLLEEFIGLDTPRVPGFNGDEIKLYLEVILPLFYIEQKYGWSGLAPRVPTHYRIRTPYRRAAEFALGLGTLERLKERDRLNTRLGVLNEEWSSGTDLLNRALRSQGWSLSRPLATLATSDSTIEELTVGVETDDAWIPATSQLAEMRAQLRALSALPVSPASERTDLAKAELAVAERELSGSAGKYRVQSELVSNAAAEQHALISRRDELQIERETLLDVRKLERLGSELHSTSLGTAHCPTCAQSLDAGSVATGIVMDVAANLALLDAEKVTLVKLIESATVNVEAAQYEAAATRQTIDGLRGRIRSLKDELSGPSAAPSVVQIEERLALADRLRSAETELANVHSQLEALRRRALDIVSVRDQLRALRGKDEDGEDGALVQRFRSLFSAALSRFGLRSLPVSEVTIGADSLLPEQGGFELTFDIQHGLSASDAIRTKWAHYVAMAQTTAQSPTGHPLGILILDEPRQQEAEFESVKALYSELARVAETTQVIVASSASDDEMTKLLDGLPVHLIRTAGTHMFTVTE